MAFPAGWSRACPISVSGASTGNACADFILPLTEACLPADLFGNAKLDGGDIRFSADDAGASPLPCHVSEYDSAGTATIFVGIPTLPGTGTTIYLWYGNPSASAPAATDPEGRNAAYGASAHAVWNMSGAPGVVVDESGNNRDLSPDAGMDASHVTSDGHLGGNAVFLDYVNATYENDSFPWPAAATVIGWLRSVGSGNWGAVDSWLTGGDASGKSVECELPDSGSYLSFRYGTARGRRSGDANWGSNQTWRRFAFTADTGSGAVQWYLDGEAPTTSQLVNINSATANSIRVGYQSYADISALWVFDEVKSADWMAAHWESQNNPGGFSSAGAPEDKGATTVLFCGMDGLPREHAPFPVIGLAAQEAHPFSALDVFRELVSACGICVGRLLASADASGLIGRLNSQAVGYCLSDAFPHMAVLRIGDRLVLGVPAANLEASRLLGDPEAVPIVDSAGHDLSGLLLENISSEVVTIAARAMDGMTAGVPYSVPLAILDRLSAEAQALPGVDSIRKLILSISKSTDSIRAGELSGIIGLSVDRLSKSPGILAGTDGINEVILAVGKLADIISQGVVSIPGSGIEAIQAKDITSVVASSMDGSPPPPLFPAEKIPDIDASIPAEHCVGNKYAIFMDGMPIADRVLSMSFLESSGSVHDQLTITSSDRELWRKSDPKTNPGQPRVELLVGTRHIRFIIDDRELTSEHEFRIVCLTLGAMNEKHLVGDWAPPSVTDFPMAKDLAENMLPKTAVVWGLPVNWKVHSDFEHGEGPIDSLQVLAKIAKASIRPLDDGRVSVERKWKVRPIHMQAARPDIFLDRSIAVGVTVPTMEPGTGHDCIEVSGVDTSASTRTPTIEIEEDSPAIGEDVHARVYWERDVPKKEVETAVTAGEMVRLDNGEEIVPPPDEDPAIIDFTEGTASVSKPISRIDSIEWIGRSAGPVTFESQTKGLKSGGMWGVARIRYATKYTRYRIFGHSVEKIIAAWGYAGESTANTRVKVCYNTSDASSPADPVEDAGITGEAVGVERGTAELDDTAYDKTSMSVEVPYHDDARVGGIVNILNEEIYVRGNFRIVEVETRFEGPAIWQTIKEEMCHCPELSE